MKFAIAAFTTAVGIVTALQLAVADGRPRRRLRRLDWQLSVLGFLSRRGNLHSHHDPDNRSSRRCVGPGNYRVYKQPGVQTMSREALVVMGTVISLLAWGGELQGQAYLVKDIKPG